MSCDVQMSESLQGRCGHVALPRDPRQHQTNRSCSTIAANVPAFQTDVQVQLRKQRWPRRGSYFNSSRVTLNPPCPPRPGTRSHGQRGSMEGRVRGLAL